MTKSENLNKLNRPDEIPDEEFAPLDDSEKNSEFAEVEGKTYLQDAWSRFKKNKLALVSLVFLAAMVLLAVFVPMLSPYTYDEMDAARVNALPGASHLLGTDKFGRDILVRLMSGARISLSVGFAAAIMNLVIGVVYGGICGYIGGKTDMILMRVVDIIYSVPTLLYVILIMLVLGPNTLSVLIAIGISSWVGMARLVR
ncbi:MAG: ABC transporter permease, partial [Oscillospiraceae bacterium]|nr:ABC transporter permease [Oscillospiraceae bacterium]